MMAIHSRNMSQC